MVLDELREYKQKLMATFCSDKEIVRLLTDRTDLELPCKSLMYTQVYPYEFIPETVDEGKTFICFDIDIINVRNKTFYTPAIYIWPFTHKSSMLCSTVDGGRGIRTDLLAKRIDELLNGSRYFGLGTLNLFGLERCAPTTDYRGRVLTYSAVDFNRPGPKAPPAYRHSMPV